MSDSSILITGAAGFAGRHLLASLRASGNAGRMVAWTRQATQPAAGDPVQWHQVDITNRESVTRSIIDTRPDRLVHLAGSPHVGQSWRDSYEPLRTNVIGTHHVLDAIRKHHHDCRVLVVTSGTIYRTSDDALDEDAPLGPASPYAFSKLAQDQLALVTAQDGLDVVVARPFNHVGPGQDPAFFLSSFAKQIAMIEAGLAPPGIHVGNLEAERDLTDVRDVADAYVQLLARGRSGRPYNVCSGRTHKIGDLLDRLIAMAHVPVSRVVDPERLRPSDVPRLLGDNSRLRKELGWEPTRTIGDTLTDTLEYWRTAVRDGRLIP